MVRKKIKTKIEKVALCDLAIGDFFYLAHAVRFTRPIVWRVMEEPNQYGFPVTPYMHDYLSSLPCTHLIKAPYMNLVEPTLSVRRVRVLGHSVESGNMKFASLESPYRLVTATLGELPCPSGFWHNGQAYALLNQKDPVALVHRTTRPLKRMELPIRSVARPLFRILFGVVEAVEERANPTGWDFEPW